MDIIDQGFVRRKLFEKLKNFKGSTINRNIIKSYISEILAEEPIYFQGINEKKLIGVAEPPSMVNSSEIGHGGVGVDKVSGDVPTKSSTIGRNAQHMLRDLSEEELKSSDIGKWGTEFNFPGGDIPAKTSNIGKADQSISQARP